METTMRVLVVDDDQAICRLLEAQLAREGFAVASTCSGQEALENVVVVMLSDSEEPAEIQMAYELGAQWCLAKYPSSKTLAKILEQVDLTGVSGVEIPVVMAGV